MIENSDIQEKIGEWLGAGYGDDDIVTELVSGYELDEQDAIATLKKVYDRWQHLREELDLDKNRLTDWHVFMRKRILQTTMGKGDTSSLRLALSILDSLASIQRVPEEHESRSVPLSIVLKERSEKDG